MFEEEIDSVLKCTYICKIPTVITETFIVLSLFSIRRGAEFFFVFSN